MARKPGTARWTQDEIGSFFLSVQVRLHLFACTFRRHCDCGFNQDLPP